MVLASLFFFFLICPTGLQAEGLFYRDPGPPVSHSGGLLEDGVGVEVSFNRYAHRAQREGAGTVQEGVGKRSFRFSASFIFGACVCAFCPELRNQKGH